MVKIGNYDPYETDITFELNEGDLTVKEGFGDFGKDTIIGFSSEIKKGDYVTLDIHAGYEKLRVIKASTSADKIIGQVIDEPAFNGSRPTKSANEGHYEPRVATVRLFGDYVLSLPLISSNQDMECGDELTYKGNNQFDKSSTTTGNSAIALESIKDGATGNKGSVLALFGYRGVNDS